ncbi:hypothetical protein GGTG_13346 [Gaeumannomyces tritici R3-111a-1]|uniref:Uncharacterized protein n=1 Tax=Gaeumannomyces tritici (strain R3-111a-1) TaxID=644352 RepID=J3PIL7_GAET3|nr:hypothetical protein GGTG_13346 [Gaeumannomyces tritici R3-111a-1]EJT69078.1 hypothetical protein GGTG_13346 [Gaeumannomyces tritici R3-111a-1]
MESQTILKRGKVYNWNRFINNIVPEWYNNQQSQKFTPLFANNDRRIQPTRKAKSQRLQGLSPFIDEVKRATSKKLRSISRKRNALPALDCALKDIRVPRPMPEAQMYSCAPDCSCPRVKTITAKPAKDVESLDSSVVKVGNLSFAVDNCAPGDTLVYII